MELATFFTTVFGSTLANAAIIVVVLMLLAAFF